MALRQISVFLENKSGRLAEVTGLLGSNGINLRAISIADTADFGILRMIVDKPGEALKVFEANHITARENRVLGVEVDDTPGGLARIMELFDATGVNIEYLYSSLENDVHKAIVIFKVEDVEHGIKILEKHGIRRISGF